MVELPITINIMKMWNLLLIARTQVINRLMTSQLVMTFTNG